MAPACCLCHGCCVLGASVFKLPAPKVQPPPLLPAVRAIAVETAGIGAVQDIMRIAVATAGGEVRKVPVLSDVHIISRGTHTHLSVAVGRLATLVSMLSAHASSLQELYSGLCRLQRIKSGSNRRATWSVIPVCMPFCVRCWTTLRCRKRLSSIAIETTPNSISVNCYTTTALCGPRLSPPAGTACHRPCFCVTHVCAHWRYHHRR